MHGLVCMLRGPRMVNLVAGMGRNAAGCMPVAAMWQLL